MMEPSQASAFRELTLQQVYVTVDVAKIEREDASAAVVPAYFAKLKGSDTNREAQHMAEAAKQLEKWQRITVTSREPISNVGQQPSCAAHGGAGRTGLRQEHGAA